jgi:hypothetical protein
LVLSFFECRSISILPMRPVFWSSRRSSSGPKSPSVWPKTAPITSGFSTTPSISNLACITYFIVNVWDVPVSVHFLFCELFNYVNHIKRIARNDEIFNINLIILSACSLIIFVVFKSLNGVHLPQTTRKNRVTFKRKAQITIKWETFHH